MPAYRPSKVDWNEVHCFLREQLKPYGYNGNYSNKTFDVNKRRLVEMVKRTSLMGESNSALIIGPRGSGKSALIDDAIQCLYEEKTIKNNLIPVYLNGLIHTDDNIALKDIVRQLQLDNVGDAFLGSFAEKLTFLLEALKSGSKQNKSILFVLHEFDLFCTHKDQTLLYNLFDVAQSQQSPICVIGMSCRPDILSKLENRVRSRFSHQLLYLLDNVKFSDYMSAAKEFLKLPSEFPNAKFRNTWNENVEAVLSVSTVQDVFKKYYCRTANFRDLKRYLLCSVTSICSTHPNLDVSDFVNSFSFHSRDGKAAILHGLSILELSLIISMMHLTELYEGEPFNFEMIYHEYKKFLQKKMSFRSLDKAVVMKAFEHLLAMELVKEVSNPNTKTMKRYTPVRLLLESSQIKESVNCYPNLPFELQQWALSSIVE